MAISKRNSRIGELLDTKKFSYAVIAEKVGTTRNAVAGVAFRRRHPYPTLICSANSDGANMLGTGFRRSSYYPENTAHQPARVAP
jgi:hypothetical protein